MHSKAIITSMILLISSPSPSAVFCVQNASDLRAALAAAEDNFEADSVRLQTGTYLTNGNAFRFHDKWGYDLTISGGWNEVQNTPCATQSGLTDIFSTVLDAEQSSPVMSISFSDHNDLKVSGLAFINGQSTTEAAGLEVSGPSTDIANDFLIENNVFINNNQQGSPNLRASALNAAGAETLVVRNNLFTENSGAAPTIRLDNAGEAALCYMLNNTVYGNSSGVYIRNQDLAKNALWVANNVIQNNNTSHNLEVVGNGLLRLLSNNNLDGYTSTNPIVTLANINLPSRFEPGVYSFTPSAASPLVDNGLSSIAGSDIGDFALGGEMRIQSLGPDIGAFESSNASELIFWDRFE